MEAITLAKKIGASAYAECSAKSLTNVTAVLKQIVKFAKPHFRKHPQQSQNDEFEMFNDEPEISTSSAGIDSLPTISTALPTIDFSEPLFPSFDLPLAAIEPPSAIESLDNRIISKVLSYLSPIELSLCCEVNRLFNQKANQQELWEVHCQALDPSYLISQSDDSPKVVYQVLAGAWINDFSTEPMLPPG